MPFLIRTLKKDPVMYIAGLLAAATAFFVPPDARYAEYIDVRTLALLFALMAVVGALKHRGALDAAAAVCVRRAGTRRGLCAMLALLCYFGSMLITNDVALIAFVPLALILMRDDPRAMALTVVIQTVAANLGSMLTPFGNPQNLYLYSAYRMDLGDFFLAVLPAGAVGLVAVLLLCRLLPAAPLDKPVGQSGDDRARLRGGAGLWLPVLLFLLCVASVLRFVPYYVAAAATIAGLLVADRAALKAVDYRLLLTFCFFFVFVGNLGRVDAVKEALSGVLAGREVVVSALASQLVSNVPAALMLSGFTGDGASLVTGTNIGGLGTLIASMASLISFKLYCAADGARPGKYLLTFTWINVALLVVMLAAFGGLF